MARLISSIEKICGIQHGPSSSPRVGGVDSEFVEIVKHRAEMVLAYIEAQKQAALAEEASAGRWERDVARRYQQEYDLFLKLHKQYLDALNNGRSQVAHELLGDIYELIYRCKHDNRKRPRYFE
jgi:uncharacterized protein YukE